MNKILLFPDDPDVDTNYRPPPQPRIPVNHMLQPPLPRPSVNSILDRPPCYYQVLGVNRKASEVEIQRAFLLAVFLEHPNRRGGSAKSGKRLLAVANAYSTLTDPNLRSKYDNPANAWRELAPQWIKIDDDHNAHHPDWPRDVDMNDLGLLVAYGNILLDAYILQSTDAERRLPMLAGVPASLISLLATAEEQLTIIFDERPAKELLASIVKMAYRESAQADRDKIMLRQEEKMATRRGVRAETAKSRSHSQSAAESSRNTSIGLGFPPAPPLPPAATPFPRRGTPPPHHRRTSSGGVRHLVAVLEERTRSDEEERDREDTLRRRRASKESTISTSSKMKKKVTFEVDAPGRRGSSTCQLEKGERTSENPPPSSKPPSILDNLERAEDPTKSIPKILEEESNLYDSPNEDAYLSDVSLATSCTYESAVDLDELDEALAAESPAPDALGPERVDSWLTVLSVPLQVEAGSSWIWKRAGARTPPPLSFEPLAAADSESVEGTQESEILPTPTEDAPQERPPSPTASVMTTATRRRVRDVIAEKLPELRNPFSKANRESPCKPSRAESIRSVSSAKSTKSWRKVKKNKDRKPTPEDLQMRPRPGTSYPPITDEDFNALTRRPISPTRPEEPQNAMPDLDYLSLANSRFKPSRFLDDPHRVMDEVFRQGPSRPLHPPSRRAPTVRSSQSSAVMNMSSGEESLRPSSTRSTSVLSFTATSKVTTTTKSKGPQVPQMVPLARVSSRGTTGSFSASPPSPVAHIQPLPTASGSRFRAVRNMSSQSLDEYRRIATNHSSSSLPLTAFDDRGSRNSNASFFRRMRDQNVSEPDLASIPSSAIVFNRRNKGKGKKPMRRVTSPVAEYDESSAADESENESDLELENDFRFARFTPRLSHSSSHTDELEVTTPSSYGIHKPLPHLPPNDPRFLHFAGPGRKIPMQVTQMYTQQQKPQSILTLTPSSSTPDLLNRTAYFPTTPAPSSQFPPRRSSSSITFIDSFPGPSLPFPIDCRQRRSTGHTRQASSPAMFPTPQRPASILHPARLSQHQMSSSARVSRKGVSISPPMPLGSVAAAPSVVITPPTPRREHCWLGSLCRHRRAASESHSSGYSDNMHLRPPVEGYSLTRADEPQKERATMADDACSFKSSSSKPSGMRHFMSMFSRNKKPKAAAPAGEFYPHPSRAQSCEFERL